MNSEVPAPLCESLDDILIHVVVNSITVQLRQDLASQRPQIWHLVIDKENFEVRIEAHIDPRERVGRITTTATTSPERYSASLPTITAPSNDC